MSKHDKLEQALRDAGIVGQHEKVTVMDRRKTPKAMLCDLCGEVDELRPYGPNGENICFDCGMADEETTGKRFMQTVFKEGFDA